MREGWGECLYCLSHNRAFTNLVFGFEESTCALLTTVGNILDKWTFNLTDGHVVFPS